MVTLWNCAVWSQQTNFSSCQHTHMLHCSPPPSGISADKLTSTLRQRKTETETNCVGPAGEKSKDSPVHTPVSSLDCQCWNCMSMWSAERFLCPDTTVPSPFRPVHKSQMKSVMNEEDWTNTLVPSSHPPSNAMLSACWPLSHWHNYMHSATKKQKTNFIHSETLLKTISIRSPCNAVISTFQRNHSWQFW